MSVSMETGEGRSEFPKTTEGRTYHVQTKRGEIANRMIFVGHLGRAESIASKYLVNGGHLDRTSDRQMRTITGLYKRKSDGKLVPMTIMGTGMGFPMTDFAVRECRSMIDGEIAVIRLGTCGCLKKEIPLGDIVVSEACVKVTRNADAFGKGVENPKYYLFSKPIFGTEKLSKMLYDNLKKTVSANIHVGWNGSCCSFYSSQGRVLGDFEDKNESLIDDLIKEYPKMTTLEMETFHQYDLARCSKVPMYTSAATITLAQRATKLFLDSETKHKREKEIGLAALETLAHFPLKGEMLEDTEEVKMVWNQK